MKIGYDAKRLFCNHRGLGNYSRDLIRILSHYYPDNQYTLYTPKIKIDVALNSSNCEVVMPEGVYRFLPSALWRNNGISSEIKSRSNDIYHGLNQEFPVGIENVKVQKIITFHDAIFMRYPELYDASYRYIFTKKNKRSIQIADKIIAISEQSKRDAIEFFNADPAKIDVVYQGCNNIFRTLLSNDEKERIRTKYQLPQNFLLFVGAIEPRKNIASIIKALSSHKIDLPLIVVGRETNYCSELRKMASALNVSDRILYRHDVSTPDLPAFYQMAEIFVYPSIFEGFGIPVLEALCSLTPVITTAGSCFPETGGEKTIYVNPNDSEEIATAIQTVLNNGDLRKSMIENGYIHSLKFTDDNIARNLMSVYQKL